MGEAKEAPLRINVARLKDLEQGRFQQPDSALVAYLTVICCEPEKRQAAGAQQSRLYCS